MVKVDLLMDDGSALLDVSLFHNKELADSAMITTKEIQGALDGKGIVHFGNDCIQGAFIPQRVQSSSIKTDEVNELERIKEFAAINNAYYDINDTAEFIHDNKLELLHLLKNL